MEVFNSINEVIMQKPVHLKIRISIRLTVMQTTNWSDCRAAL